MAKFVAKVKIEFEMVCKTEDYGTDDPAKIHQMVADYVAGDLNAATDHHEGAIEIKMVRVE